VICAVVLAAGRSSRVGRPKALLPVEGDTFVSRIVRTLARGGADEVIVVAGPGGEADIRSALQGTDGPVTIVTNPAPERGQLSSLLAALDTLAQRQVEAVLVTLVDLPLLSETTVRAVIDAYRRHNRPSIARATYRGAHGHPVLFDRSIFDELRAADPEAGAREVTHRHAASICNVEVDDPGLANDVDTWSDYERLIGERT
jgi:molybdenum cofactor cytidylyltransferase